jgi:hypothetical protein
MRAFGISLKQPPESLSVRYASQKPLLELVFDPKTYLVTFGRFEIGSVRIF